MRTKSAYTENDIVNVSFTRSIRTGHCNALIERRIATMTSPKGELGQSRRLSIIIIIDYYIVKIDVFDSIFNICKMMNRKRRYTFTISRGSDNREMYQSAQ